MLGTEVLSTRGGGGGKEEPDIRIKNPHEGKIHDQGPAGAQILLRQLFKFKYFGRQNS